MPLPAWRQRAAPAEAGAGAKASGPPRPAAPSRPWPAAASSTVRSVASGEQPAARPGLAGGAAAKPPASVPPVDALAEQRREQLGFERLAAAIRALPEPRPGASPAEPSRWQRLRWEVTDRVPDWLRRGCGLELRTWLALLLVLVVAVGFAVHHFWTERARAVPVAEPALAEPSGTPAEAESPTGDDAGREVVVDVAGEVREPGLYRLPGGSRVADALTAAGGPVEAEDAQGLNQARLLVDGEQLLVSDGPPAVAGGPSAGQPPAGQPAAPVSLNSASPEQLEELPGIGPVLAQEIVAYRQQQGGFTAVEQLGEVSGIGERRLAELRDRVTL
ncbi:ComEA family DNA-binding protein [Streptomyces sp. DSM 44915]|uniref:ComEA family DNA-binding protein n=1 Tax=Streptomyces chisholmiae TaxID=3075540 RepID=A0ABU2K066_9ACTN|nr:ComEA family DNA-binding protein [Streptomyces sp. DSM 44915]MDT0270648.1 ComEA family DNA-binding protein [Streptomyces sp. DSM 44915]